MKNVFFFWLKTSFEIVDITFKSYCVVYINHFAKYEVIIQFTQLYLIFVKRTFNWRAWARALLLHICNFFYKSCNCLYFPYNCKFGVRNFPSRTITAYQAFYFQNILTILYNVVSTFKNIELVFFCMQCFLMCWIGFALLFFFSMYMYVFRVQISTVFWSA